VSAPLLLLGFAAVLAFVVPGRLAGAGWAVRAPRLAILAWHAVGYAVLISSGLAAAVSLMHWSASHDLACATWQVCLDALRGAHGRTGQVAAFAGLATLAILATRLSTAWWQMTSAGGRVRRRQLEMLHLAGTVRADLGATVVPAADPAAYLVPGRHPHVVVTTEAVHRLAPSELAAVLEHERAHAAGHHHRLRAAAGLLHRAFPGVPVFADASRQVNRLVELCADDAAVRRQGALPLARALVALATPAPDPHALHAAGGDPAERLHRLLQPPRPLPWPARAAAAAAWALLPVVPVVIVALERLAPAWTHVPGGL
jgi:Zn-dependent protease with chaperone function